MIIDFHFVQYQRLHLIGSVKNIYQMLLIVLQI